MLNEVEANIFLSYTGTLCRQHDYIIVEIEGEIEAEKAQLLRENGWILSPASLYWYKKVE